MSLQSASFINNLETNQEVILITGVCRSGKTLLGNILATFNEVEYADEPYALMMLPMIAASGKINEDLASSWMKAMLNELFNDLLLLRAANFRPGDLSSIWTKKNPEDIFSRLLQITNRDQAKAYAKNSCSKLIITLSECIPFLDFIIKTLPNVNIVHVIRNPFDVAEATVQKKWYSDAQLKQPLMAQPYCAYHYLAADWYVPWWVNDDEYDYFLKLNEFERGLYYWWALIVKSMYFKHKTIVVRYEDLIENPTVIVKNLAHQFQLTEGYFTSQKIKEIKQNQLVSPPAIDRILKDRLNNVMKEFYECELS